LATSNHLDELLFQEVDVFKAGLVGTAFDGLVDAVA
jgi:hypothetical protein